MSLHRSDLEYILGHFGSVDSFEILPITEVQGFQGTYYNLKISSNGKAEKYFVKVIPEGSEIVNGFYLRSGAFVKEVEIYTRLLPILDEHKLGSLWPKCHVGVEGRYLVLQHMEDAGWKMTKNMDCEHMEIVLSGLAKLHASSLSAGEDSHFQRMSQSILKETMFSEDASHPGREMWDSFCRIASEILPENGLFNLLQRVVGKINSPTKFSKCMNHGDLWMNNMFFKYAQGKPVDVVFVDFQSARFAPPALDLAIFTHIFVPENADEFALMYYEKLELCLGNTQHSPFMTKAEFLDSFEYYKETGMCIAALYVFLTRLPAKYLSEILVSQDTFIPFALGRNYTPAMSAIEEVPFYRNEVVRALRRVVDYHSLHAI